MDELDRLDDAVAAAAFRRLVRHLRHRSDAQNVALMGLAGFCRNCLSDWVNEASADRGAHAVNGDTVFEIASLTKVFTALLLAFRSAARTCRNRPSTGYERLPSA